MPTTSNPAATIGGAPNRSLKNTAPIAAPTMIELRWQPAIAQGAAEGDG